MGDGVAIKNVFGQQTRQSRSHENSLRTETIHDADIWDVRVHPDDRSKVVHCWTYGGKMLENLDFGINEFVGRSKQLFVSLLRREWGVIIPVICGS